MKEITTEATLGVGDGSGQMFVHGSYDAIKLLQTKLFKYEKFVSEHEDQKCITQDQLLDMLRYFAYNVYSGHFVHEKTVEEILNIMTPDNVIKKYNNAENFNWSKIESYPKETI